MLISRYSFLMLVVGACLISTFHEVAASEDIIFIEKKGSVTRFMLRGSIKKEQSYVSAQFLSDSEVPKLNDRGEQYFSLKKLINFDCDNHTYMDIYIEAYTDRMGKGRVLYRSENPFAKWSKVEPDTLTQSSFIFACRYILT